MQTVQRQPLPQRLTVLDLNAANFQQPIDFGLGEATWRFVTCDAVFIQASGFWTRIEDGYIMALHRQPMRR